MIAYHACGVPADIPRTRACVMTNFDHSIDRDLEAQLKRERIAMGYTAWNFFGAVWFDQERKKFCCAINVYQVHVETIEAETLEEIMEIASQRYGSD